MIKKLQEKIRVILKFANKNMWKIIIVTLLICVLGYGLELIKNKVKFLDNSLADIFMIVLIFIFLHIYYLYTQYKNLKGFSEKKIYIQYYTKKLDFFKNSIEFIISVLSIIASCTGIFVIYAVYKKAKELIGSDQMSEEMINKLISILPLEANDLTTMILSIVGNCLLYICVFHFLTKILILILDKKLFKLEMAVINSESN